MVFVFHVPAIPSRAAAPPLAKHAIMTEKPLSIKLNASVRTDNSVPLLTASHAKHVNPESFLTPIKLCARNALQTKSYKIMHASIAKVTSSQTVLKEPSVSVLSGTNQGEAPTAVHAMTTKSVMACRSVKPVAKEWKPMRTT